MPSGSSIPRWKAELLEKRKTAQRSRGDSVPVWKRELLKKLHSSKSVGEASGAAEEDDGKVVDTDPIVKVSQNIFIVRETKTPKLKKQQSSVSGFSIPRSEDVHIIEHQQPHLVASSTTNSNSNQQQQQDADKMENDAENLPIEGMVQRLKNRFSNHTATSATTCDVIGNKFHISNKHHTRAENEIIKKKSPPLAPANDTTTTTVKKRENNQQPQTRRVNSEIDLFNTTAPTNHHKPPTAATNAKPPPRAASVDLLAPVGFHKTPPHPVKSVLLDSAATTRQRNGGNASLVRLDEPVTVDASRMDAAKARAYNQLMESSKTFRVTPRARASPAAPVKAPAALIKAPAPQQKTTAEKTKVEVEQKLASLPCTDIDNVIDSSSPQPAKQADTEPPPPPPVVKTVEKTDPKPLPPQNHKASSSSSSSSSSEDESAKSAVSTPQQSPATAVVNKPAASAKFGTSSVGGSGKTFTINPKKFGRSAAPPIATQSKQKQSGSNTITITPSARAKQPERASEVATTAPPTSGKRKPGVDQIEVVGGYVKLSKSLLKPARTSAAHNNSKKKSVRFSIDRQEFRPGEGFNTNNNNNNLFGRNLPIYVPDSERSLDDVIGKSRDQSTKPTQAPIKPAPITTHNKTKTPVKDKFVTCIDDHDTDASSSSATTSSDDDDDEDDVTQALPADVDHAAFFSDVTTSDLLF